jgi:hypothetical protein
MDKKTLEQLLDAIGDVVTANGWEGSDMSVYETQPHLYYRMLKLRDLYFKLEETE